MRLELEVITDFDELSASSERWRHLLAQSADDQPTLTPAWLESWWRVFGKAGGRELSAVVLSEGDRWVALAPLCRRTHSYAPGLAFRRIELLASGESEADEICSDYIGVISERGRELDVADALAQALVSNAIGDWDELVMPSMNGESLVPWALAEALRRRGVPASAEISTLSPYAPLSSSFEDYLGKLSSSRRYHVRRSLRDFERWAGGRAQVDVARNEAELAKGFELLVELHRERWQAKGEPGVFGSKSFRAFHELVMPRLLSEGSLDLSWLSVDGTPIAACYNLVHAGRVQFYQSGRRADLPTKVRPGLVLHAHAMERAIAAGHHEYDFLPGASDYKLGLALATRPVVTLRAARPTLRETARMVGEQVLARARGLRATVAPESQALQAGAPVDSRSAGDSSWPRILQSLWSAR